MPDVAPPLVSVIVPTHDRPDLLASAMQSILNQSIDAFEVIVIDDASSPPAAIPDDARFRLIRLDTRTGVANARNCGLSAANADLVCFLDDDDLMTPVRLQIAVDHAADPVTVCAGGQIGLRTSSVRTLTGDVSDTILDTATPYLGCVSVQRSIAPPFDVRFDACEDVDWFLRLAASHRFVTTKRVGLLWRSHDDARPVLDAAARLAGSRRLLEIHSAYFARHRRAGAYSWFRVATYAQQMRRPGAAMSAAVRSAMLQPTPSSLLRSWRVVTAALHRSSPTTGEASH